MPSSKPAPLSFINDDELRDQLNFVLDDIYSKLDFALELDNKGIMQLLTYGGLGKDVSGFNGLLQVSLGETNEITIGDYLQIISNKLSVKALEIIALTWPVGSIFISTIATNPATLLGIGTWQAIGTGRTIVGIDTGDADFDTAEEIGGAKTHKHSVDVPSTTSGAPSATTEVASGTGATVASSTHTCMVDPAAIDSDIISNVMPYIVVYMWKRVS